MRISFRFFGRPSNTNYCNTPPQRTPSPPSSSHLYDGTIRLLTRTRKTQYAASSVYYALVSHLVQIVKILDLYLCILFCACKSFLHTHTRTYTQTDTHKMPAKFYELITFHFITYDNECFRCTPRSCASRSRRGEGTRQLINQVTLKNVLQTCLYKLPDLQVL